MPRSKDEINEYHRKWRERNKGHLDKYREKNKERHAIWRREYNAKNLNRILTKKREWRERNVEHRAKSYDSWYENNKERKQAQNLAWQASNKDKVAEYRRIYSAEKPWLSLLGTARRRAKNDSLEYALSREWARSTWTGKCALSGIELEKGEGRQHMRSPSIDRVDPSKGYIPGNCRFICLALNRMKSDGTDNEMLEIMIETLDFITSSEAICNPPALSCKQADRHL